MVRESTNNYDGVTERIIDIPMCRVPYSPDTGKGYFGYVGASKSRPVAVLGARKRLYRRLGQMFLRWAETGDGA